MGVKVKVSSISKSKMKPDGNQVANFPPLKTDNKFLYRSLWRTIRLNSIIS